MSEGQGTLLEQALAQSAGAVPAAPEFMVPPSGRYILDIRSASFKQIDWQDKQTKEDKSAIKAEMVYSVVETLELADPNALAVPEGSLFMEGVSLEFNGESPLKTYATKFFGDQVENLTWGEIIAALGAGDVRFSCTVRTREKGGFENSRTSQQEPVVG